MTAPAAASPDPVRGSRTGAVSALGRDAARAARGDPGFAWALGVGIALIALGLLGFVQNPFVGSPSPAWGQPLLLTGDSHDVLHLVGGAVALHAALGMSRPRRDVVLIGLGTVALVLLALGLLDGRWFGIAPFAVGFGDQLLHLVVGLGSLLVGLAGRGTIVVPGVTGAYAVVRPPAEAPSGTGAERVAVASGPEPAEVVPETLGLDFAADTPGPGPEPEPTGAIDEPDALEPDPGPTRAIHEPDGVEPELTGAIDEPDAVEPDPGPERTGSLDDPDAR